MNRNWNIRDVTIPECGMEVMKDRWWLCINDLTQALFYGDSAQCNSNKEICLTMNERPMYLEAAKQFNGELKLIFAPIAYRYVDHAEFHR